MARSRSRNARTRATAARLAAPRAIARKPLAPLRTSASFKDFVLDQLSEIDGLGDRAMFGGVGIYARGVFFALIAADVLYFKVDDATRSTYEAAGSGPFRPYGAEAAMSSYYNVPVEVFEHAPTLVVWARRAIDAARAASTPSSRRK